MFIEVQARLGMHEGEPLIVAVDHIACVVKPEKEDDDIKDCCFICFKSESKAKRLTVCINETYDAFIKRLQIMNNQVWRLGDFAQ